MVTLDHRCFAGLWSRDAYGREIDSPNSDLLLLEGVAAPGAAPCPIAIGCAWAIVDEAHITLLGVDPDYQGQGLGQWLLVWLLGAARDRGLTHATLEVRQSNARAQALYAKFGFAVAGERRKYYPDGENALILWRSGLQTSAFATSLHHHQGQLVQRLAANGFALGDRPLPLPQG
ncbi:MAG TPA: ribosomal protein S18-alanine N-acetyltransferase [Candidatus Obscuribacterales bacterium]